MLVTIAMENGFQRAMLLYRAAGVPLGIAKVGTRYPLVDTVIVIELNKK